MIRRAWPAVLGLLLVLLLGSAPAVAEPHDALAERAAARSAAPSGHAPATGRPGVEITELDGILGEEGRVTLTTRVTTGAEPLSDLRLLLTIHGQTRSRFALAQAVDADEAGPALATTETAGIELAREDEAELQLRPTAADLGLEGAPPGVYPATVTVLDATGTLAEMSTAFVVAPEGGEPLRLSLLLSFEGPVATRADEPHDASAVVASAERAQALPLGLEDAPPLTLAVDGRTVEELEEAASGSEVAPDDPDAVAAAGAALEHLNTLTGQAGSETVAFPYGPADLVALIRSGMASEAQHLLDRAQAVADALDGAPTTETRLVVAPDGLDAPTAGWLSGVARATVLDELALGLALERELPATPPSVRTLAGIPGLLVAVPDPFVADLLDRPGLEQPPALAAQRIIAESAAIFFERPGSTTPRGLLVAPPPREATELVPALANGLRDASWVEAVPLTRLLDDVPPAPEPETLSYSQDQRSAELPAGYLQAAAEARDHLDPLGALLGDEATAGLDQRLDTVSAVGFRGSVLRPHGDAITATTSEMVGRLQRGIAVVEGPPLTLTGTEGTVPVTLRSTAEEDVNVRVRVLTTRYAVEDEGGRVITVPADGHVTTTFDVVALAPGGTYPVAVEITDPSERLELASGQVVVRSTAFSVAGRVVTGGAALFLLAWAVHGLVRRRRTPPPEHEREGGIEEAAGASAGGAR